MSELCCAMRCKHTMGEARLPEIKTELEKRIASGELIEVPRREGEAGRAFTTGEMQGYERDIVRRMQAGRDINVIVDGVHAGVDLQAASAPEREPAPGGRRCA